MMNAVKTNITRALPKDAAAVAALLYSAFVEYESFYTEKGFASSTPSAKEIEDRIYKKAVWLALYDNEIAGTVSVFPQAEELFIRSMAVSPAARGKGIGKMLMEHVHEMAHAHGCSSIRLNTTPFLLQAIRLYESFGFKRRWQSDLHGTPLIWMVKSFKPGYKK